MEGTEITIPVGKWRGRTYNMTVRPDYTNLEDTENIGEKLHVSINVYYREKGEKHEIVRIDNSHSYMHIHRLYSAQEEDVEEIQMTYWEAMKYIQQNLERFARLYEENHV